jgi:hypothetical protein
MAGLKDRVEIPVRTSSIKKEEESSKDARKELKKRKSLHREKQAEFDPLRDVEYWDHQVALKDCEIEDIEQWLRRSKEKLNKQESTSEDYLELDRSAARQKAEKNDERLELVAQRDKLENYLTEHSTGLKKELHDAKEAFTMILAKASNDGFRPGPRSTTMQTAFRRILIQDHNSKSPDPPKEDEEPELWCPVVKRYLPSRMMIAAHIFPYRMGEDVMTTVFGKESHNEMFSARNGLLLWTDIEHKFDRFQVAIVPARPEDPKSWKLQVLDKSLLKQDILYLPRSIPNMTWEDVNNKELIFKGNARPAARYLYYHYALSLLQLSKRRKQYDWLQEAKKRCWATPGKYIRANMLKAMAERIGHQLPEELDGFEKHLIDDSPTPKLDDKIVAHMLLKVVEEDEEEFYGSDT